MLKATQNILSLSHDKVMDFFMKSEQYHGFELPKYFAFEKVLEYIRDTITDVPYEKCAHESITSEELSDVNLDILLNKNRLYAVYPIMQAEISTALAYIC